MQRCIAMKNTQTSQIKPINLICDRKFQILFYDFSENWLISLLLSLPDYLRSSLEEAVSLATRLGTIQCSYKENVFNIISMSEIYPDSFLKWQHHIQNSTVIM